MEQLTINYNYLILKNFTILFALVRSVFSSLLTASASTLLKLPSCRLCANRSRSSNFCNASDCVIA